MKSNPLHYPRDVDPDEVFTQDTLDKLTAHIFSWQQGVGNFGALMLHACWGESSVLTRRYQGQSTFASWQLMRGAITLYKATREARWKQLARDIVSNLLFLQAPAGGFIHASNEFEPTYVAERTCPIHQSLPVVALMEYLLWEESDGWDKERILPVVERHWKWMDERMWQSGNGFIRPLPFPGWCGVTNQDLTAIAGLALHARVFGDDTRFVKQGLPCLNEILDRYYYPKIGLMERGDQANFAERTVYYEIILGMLETIFELTGDNRLLEIHDNIGLHLFDGCYRGDDGHLYFSWGATTDPSDKTKVSAWIRTPVLISSYPGLLTHLRKVLDRHADPEKQAMLADLERTLAAYVFADGTIPNALGASDPIFGIATSPNSGTLNFWLYLMDRLGDSLKDPKPYKLPVIHRRLGDLTWKTNARLWSIERSGIRLYAGWKINPHGVLHGNEETFDDVRLEELEPCDIEEELPLMNPHS